MWDLPLAVEINDKEYAIRNKCDYRVILDVISALNDDELSQEESLQCALFIFYEDLAGCEDYQKAVTEMMRIINLGVEVGNKEEETSNKPPIMDWKHDFNQIIPPINRVLGYSVRDSSKYTHWFDFVGAYQEIGDCSFATIISIRKKREKGKKLDDEEKKIYQEHKKLIDLPRKISAGEAEWLDENW